MAELAWRAFIFPLVKGITYWFVVGEDCEMSCFNEVAEVLDSFIYCE